MASPKTPAGKRFCKLSVWASRQGLSRGSAWAMFRNGTLPLELEAYQMNGRIYVRDFEAEDREQQRPTRVVGYAHIADNESMDDLNEQVRRLWRYSEDHDLEMETVIKETGVPFGEPRPELMNILNDRTVETLMVDNGSRVSRFVVDYINLIMKMRGGRFIVIDRHDSTSMLVTDVADVLHFLCARIYGRAASRDQVEQALSAMDKVELAPEGEQIYI